jgi:hypothetical protein
MVRTNTLSPYQKWRSSLPRSSLPREKAPGYDGVSTEVFQVFIEDIKDNLLRLLSKVLDTHNLIPELNTSKISLLPKKGDMTLLTNYCSISLLRSIYKIIAKFSAQRIIDHLPSWIRKS